MVEEEQRQHGLRGSSEVLVQLRVLRFQRWLFLFFPRLVFLHLESAISAGMSLFVVSVVRLSGGVISLQNFFFLQFFAASGKGIAEISRAFPVLYLQNWKSLSIKCQTDYYHFLPVLLSSAASFFPEPLNGRTAATKSTHDSFRTGFESFPYFAAVGVVCTLQGFLALHFNTSAPRVHK